MVHDDDEGVGFPVAVLISDIAAQHQMRLAWDGERYNADEFVDWYGEEFGVQCWNAAAHYSSLFGMMETNHFCALQYFPGGGAMLISNVDRGPPRVGNFGVLLPDILFILRVRHLQGKLKPSRLAPQGWHGRDVWQSPIVLGGVGGKILVADFREELYSNGHMAGLGHRNMIRDGCDFINFLEDDTSTSVRERLATNMFMDFLAVGLPESSHDSRALV